MGDHRVNLDLALHVPVDNLWHISTATRAPKGGAPPAAASHQLERACVDFLSGTGNADDDGFTPSLVTAFQRLAHDIGVTDTFKGIVSPATGQLNQMANQIITMISRVDEMGHAKTFAPCLLFIVQIDADNHIRTNHPKTLDDIQPDAAQPENNSVASGFGFGRIDDRPDAGRDPAADIADLVKRCVRVDLGKGNFRQNGEV